MAVIFGIEVINSRDFAMDASPLWQIERPHWENGYSFRRLAMKRASEALEGSHGGGPLFSGLTQTFA